MSLNKVTPGSKVPDAFNVIIEIPMNSDPVKYEVDKESGALFVDRFMGTAMHYPIPPHRQPALQGLAHGPLPLTEQLHREVLSLPLHPGLTHNEALRVIKAVNSF